MIHHFHCSFTGSFSWKVAEKCVAQGFWPDIISTDLHTGSILGPSYDLPCIMTKMLHVGMPLDEILTAVTSTPARAIGNDRIKPCRRKGKNKLKKSVELSLG